METLASPPRTARLTAAEIDAYRRDGQVTPAWRLPRPLLARMRASLDRLVAARPEVRPDFIALPHVSWDGAAGREIAREFFAYCTDPAFLDVVESLIGPDIVLWASTVFCKPPREGLEVPWHQDGQYWPIRPRATVTMWIALDDATVENGCMRVIPGTHRMGDFDHEVSDREDLVLNNVLNDPRLDLSTARNVELEAGQFSLHDIGIVHGSQPNRSKKRRAGFAIRYMPSTSQYDRSLTMGSGSNTVPVEFPRRPIWLVRGVDRCGKNDFTIGHTHW
ncbi:MAG TPA: phytanoyl-CoA dioxygenase family protein [Burkholderiales bacterium]|nr:phytanoyl-CoA dioxygenase family protein [Burkholderiales bacterium]